MKIGITGAAGFLGRALAERARRAGHEVVGFDLAAGARAEYAALGARYLVGDINDRAALLGFMEGLDRVYHTAAVVKEAGEWAHFFRVNVLGADSVALAAKAASVRELLHLSSVMVHGFDFPEGVTEDGPQDPADNPYCTTKILSEEAVMRHHEAGRFDVYIIRPGDVYGPRSVPWTVRPVAMMKRRQWVHVDADRCLFNHVYVDNLLDGIDAVLERRASGAAFTITDGARTTARGFFGHYQRLLGIAHLPSLPRRVALPAGALAGRLSSLIGVDLGVNREAVRYLLRRHAYGIGKVTALGYRPRVSLEEGMTRTAAWLRSVGLVP